MSAALLCSCDLTAVGGPDLTTTGLIVDGPYPGRHAKDPTGSCSTLAGDADMTKVAFATEPTRSLVPAVTFTLAFSGSPLGRYKRAADTHHRLVAVAGKLGRELHWTLPVSGPAEVAVTGSGGGRLSGTMSVELEEDDGFPARTTSVTGTWSCSYRPN